MSSPRLSAELGSLLPLILVAIYWGLVAASPSIEISQLVGLMLRYVQVALELLLLAVLCSFAGLLITNLIKRDFRHGPFAITRRYIQARWQTDRGLSFFVPILFFVLLLSAFNAFKQRILPHAGFGMDRVFYEWDRAFFLGTDPWRITHAIFSGPIWDRAISNVYHQYYFPMAIAVFFCAVAPMRSALRTQYLLSYAIVWIGVGSVLAYLLPSAGPAYWHQFHGDPDPYASLMQMLQDHHHWLMRNGYHGIGALNAQHALWAEFNSPVLTVGRGISGMPSVHIGLAVLFTCWTFAIRRWLGWIMLVYTIIIWIGSFHLGWHYAVDGLAAAAIIVPAWLAAGVLARRLHRDAEPSESVAAPVTA
jgi:hypothetical protein